jgi:hypothetical protein
MPSVSTRRRTLRRIATPLVAVAAAAGIAAATATPAAASNSYNGRANIYGAGNPLDDLNDEGAINRGTNTLSDVTCLWQNILYVDGELPIGGIDGSFGSQTYNSTKAWQGKPGLTQDGSAGKATFKKAGANLEWYWRDSAIVGFNILMYEGKSGTVEIHRNIDSGNWYFFTKDTGKYTKASYNSRTCS